MEGLAENHMPMSFVVDYFQDNYCSAGSLRTVSIACQGVVPVRVEPQQLGH